MPTAGGYWEQQAKRRRAHARRGTRFVGSPKPATADRFGRPLRTRNRDGLPHEPCPACGRRSMIQPRSGEWTCENCHYADRDTGVAIEPLV